MIIRLSICFLILYCLFIVIDLIMVAINKGIKKTQRNALNVPIATHLLCSFLTLIITIALVLNLVDFDMLYGHRNDAKGYGKAIEDFDNRLPEIYNNMSDDDILIITADHGCDPTTDSTDHSREYIPILVYGDSVLPTHLGTLSTYADIGATVCDLLGVSFECEGESFKGRILR